MHVRKRSYLTLAAKFSNKMNFRVHSRAAFLDNWDATFYLLNPKHGGAGAALIHSCSVYSGAQGVLRLFSEFDL